jgi:hypothetical protein
MHLSEFIVLAGVLILIFSLWGFGVTGDSLILNEGDGNDSDSNTFSERIVVSKGLIEVSRLSLNANVSWLLIVSQEIISEDHILHSTNFISFLYCV